jgi:hypothetical protein
MKANFGLKCCRIVDMAKRKKYLYKQYFKYNSKYDYKYISNEKI